MSKKTKKKGFTLIELIIVLAIFSVIMVLVMSFVDPVSKLMSKTSTREKTAAYVDNINEYIDKSLRYASFVRIFNGDYCKTTDEHDLVSEQSAVQTFIEDYFDGAIDSSGNHVTGKVHVLKLLNQPDRDAVTVAGLGTSLKDGVLVDTVYNFTAGETKPDKDGVGNPIHVYDGTSFPHAVVTLDKNELAINPEHFEHYSYFYKLGFNEFIPVSQRTITKGSPASASTSYDDSLITNPDGTANRYSLLGGGVVPISSSSDYFYSELVPMLDNSGSEMALNKYSFSVTMVAYPNDSKGNNKVICNKTITDGASDEDVTTSIFKSPSYMATSSMTLININPLLKANTTCVKKEREDGGAEKPGGKLVQVETYEDSFSGPWNGQHDNPSQNTTNIFFIYVVPSEVNNG